MTAQPVEPVDTGAIDSLNYTLADLRHYIGRLEDELSAALDFDDTLATVVRLLAFFRDLEAELGQARAYVEKKVVARMPTYTRGKRAGQPRRQAKAVAGFNVLVRGGGEWKEWADDRVVWAVCEPLVVDDNGEVQPELAQFLGLVRDRLLDAGAVDWRTTVLKEFGVDPENYATRVEKRHTVKLTPVVDEPPAVAS